jgi:hypothetical protein
MRWHLTLMLILCAFATSTLSAPAPKETSPKLELRLRVKSEKVKRSDDLVCRVAIVNKGKHRVTLVHPDDGSNIGWRTPIIEWLVDGKVHGEREPWGMVDKKPAQKVEATPAPKRELLPACLRGALGPSMRCGNINGLKAEGVFDIEPGKEVKLTGWLYRPHLSAGKHTLTLRYFNIPDLRWQGLGNHDQKAMERVKSSPKVTLESNAIEITVEE